ncbi:MAG: ArsR family transcriptional regulator [Anaerolineaceae bacterium]|nr:MAG: ArsR family transcriptional regulator [Anaerolineaceae bacterium]
MNKRSASPVLTLDFREENTLKVIKALASAPRMAILELLSEQPKNVSEIASALDMPLSTANMHISNLEEAGLLITDLRAGERGLQKVCARAYTTIMVQFPLAEQVEDDIHAIEISMPVGSYVESEVKPTCGLISTEGIIGMLDDPASFYEPARIQAQLLWFHKGYVEYRFPNRLPNQARMISLQLSLELCSEAPLHHPDWPSDITVWVNGVEIGTWTSPADFGGERGILTPSWWESNNTQYGLLKRWQVRRDGSFIDGMRCSDVNCEALDIAAQRFISVRIGVKADAQHVGGVNLFGESFGNYPQDIIMTVRYEM